MSRSMNACRRAPSLVRRWLAVPAALLSFLPAAGQVVAPPRELNGPPRALSANLVLPQSRVIATTVSPSPVVITGVDASVVLVDQVATTTLDINLSNAAPSRQEAEVLLPVPGDCVIRGFTFQGAGAEPSAALLDAGEARRTYDRIVAQTRDPALLEFAGYELVRSSVFPIEARGTQKVRLVYEQVLPAEGPRRDYVLPRSESLAYSVPWNIAVQVSTKSPLAALYSPTHKIETRRAGTRRALVRTTAEASREPGSFRLSVLVAADGPAASLLAYPDASVGGGYFLLLAGLPPAPATSAPALRREVTLVLDRSGSMNGGKLDRAREAARQIIAGLDDGESFNLIDFSDTVQSFAGGPVAKSATTAADANAYLDRLQPRGGTNLHDALAVALQPKPSAGLLPLVLLLTDGQPTMGQTSEAAIGALADKANPFERRVYTIGVGTDVNAPLLDRIATASRATSTYIVRPEEVEVRVAQVFKRLDGPVLASPKLTVLDAAGQPAPGRVRDPLPARLLDVFEGEQVVVLGQYVGDQPLAFELSGNYRGVQRTFRFNLPLANASPKNGFVRRLWASRRITDLVEAIRQSGADPKVQMANVSTITDPKLKELVGEVVRLSKDFGVLTEYTAFLAHEGTDLGQPGAVLTQAERNFAQRAIQVRSGSGGVNQGMNVSAAAVGTPTLNYSNTYVDHNLQQVTTATVQQVGDLALYRRQGQWVDSRVVSLGAAATPTRTVTVGSPEFNLLVDRLSTQGRQGAVSLGADTVLMVDGENVLVTGGRTAK